MDDSDFDEEVMLYLILRRRRRKRRKKKTKQVVPRRFWVRSVFIKREEYGEYHRLVQELRKKDRHFFFK